jgi:CheY-like chemotaxis protein
MKDGQRYMFGYVLTFFFQRNRVCSCVRQYRTWEKVNRPWDSQLIIGISANANINDNGQGLHAGMNAFVPKPITIKTLTDLQCSSEAVQRTRQLDEWEGNVNQSSNVDDRDSMKLSQSELDMQTSLFDPTSISASTRPLSQPFPGTTVSQPSVCLIATDGATTQTNQLPGQLESIGWKVVIVNDGADCLELLKMRTWTAALVEDDLAQLSGLSCIAAFRKWEEINRLNPQKNIFLVCEGEIPSPADRNSWIQPPIGCNGVLRKPVPLADFQCMLLQTNGVDSTETAGITRHHDFGGDSSSVFGLPQRNTNVGRY